ncbi:MAG: methyltransferase domain-containing protein [Nitrososphaerales archaeon]
MKCNHIVVNAMSGRETSYVWDNSETAEVSKRFESLKNLYDPITFSRIEALGIVEGWKCLEVGGGGGSVSKWLSSKVGSSGRVLVTDINPLFLNELQGKLDNVEVLTHDITSESGIPKNSFDLAHARLVLVHLSQREKALSNMVSTLKPGGRVLIEDFDWILNEVCRDYHPVLGVPPLMTTDLFAKLMQARDKVLKQHGTDIHYARRLYSMLRSNDLLDVGISVGGYGAWSGGSDGAKLHIANSLQSRKEILATGLMSEKEFDAAINLMNDPQWKVFSSMMISGWGRRP